MTLTLDEANPRCRRRDRRTRESIDILVCVAVCDAGGKAGLLSAHGRRHLGRGLRLPGQGGGVRRLRPAERRSHRAGRPPHLPRDRRGRRRPHDPRPRRRADRARGPGHRRLRGRRRHRRGGRGSQSCATARSSAPAASAAAPARRSALPRAATGWAAPRRVGAIARPEESHLSQGFPLIPENPTYPGESHLSQGIPLVPANPTHPGESHASRRIPRIPANSCKAVSLARAARDVTRAREGVPLVMGGAPREAGPARPAVRNARCTA